MADNISQESLAREPEDDARAERPTVLNTTSSRKGIRVHFQETTTPQETIDEDFGDPFDSPEDETAADSGAGSTVEEEHQSPMEHRHSSAVASKIHKRKVPVRRPTAYVSGRDGADDGKDDVEPTDTGEAATAQGSDTAQKPIPADTRLRELSKKYKSQDRSPDSEEAD